MPRIIPTEEGKMSHKHVHCEHTEVQFCGHCQTVWCKNCDKEWGDCKLSHGYPYWVYTTPTTGGTGDDIHVYTTSACHGN